MRITHSSCTMPGLQAHLKAIKLKNRTARQCKGVEKWIEGFWINFQIFTCSGEKKKQHQGTRALHMHPLNNSNLCFHLLLLHVQENEMWLTLFSDKYLWNAFQSGPDTLSLHRVYSNVFVNVSAWVCPVWAAFLTCKNSHQLVVGGSFLQGRVSSLQWARHLLSSFVVLSMKRSFWLNQSEKCFSLEKQKTVIMHSC